NSVTLAFTEVDDGTGKPAKYDVRYAAKPMSWASAADVRQGTCAVFMVGSAIGAKRTCTVLGLTTAGSYDFKLVAFRGGLNGNTVFGGVSNLTNAAPTSVASVEVSPAASSGSVGSGARFAAITRDGNGQVLTGRSVAWSSSNPAVATVDTTGWAIAVGSGSVTITATSEGKSGAAAFAVSTAAPASVASVTVTPSPVSLAVGSTQQLTATLKDASGNVLTGRTVTWSSSNLPAATVS